MKRNILKAIVISIFAIVFFINISIKGNLKSNDTNLIQQAKADYACAEHYGGITVCCISGPGMCLVGDGPWVLYWEGPYYF